MKDWVSCKLLLAENSKGTLQTGRHLLRTGKSTRIAYTSFPGALLMGVFESFA